MKAMVSTVVLLAAASMFTGVAAQAQADTGAQGQALITVMPKHDKDPSPKITPDEIKLMVDGKPANVAGITSSQTSGSNLEFVVLLDDSSRSSLGIQLGDIEHFILSLPPNAKVALGYMQYGQAQMVTPLTSDRGLVVKGLHLPGGASYTNGSPYFCLSELAKHWPSSNLHAQRDVLMVTDGIDDYERRFDPEDPYVQSAIEDAVRAHLVVYTLYWHGRGDPGSSSYVGNGGQNLLVEVTDATGGVSYWEGFGNPVSFEPFLSDLNRRLRNQYELSFSAPAYTGKPQTVSMRFKLDKAANAKVSAPQQVYIYHSNDAPSE